MPAQRSAHRRPVQAAAAAVCLVAGAALGGCESFGDRTGSIRPAATTAAPADESASRATAEAARARLRARSRREGRLDRLRPGAARSHPLRRSGRGDAGGGGQGAEGRGGARRIRQGAGRRRPTRPGQRRADPRLSRRTRPDGTYCRRRGRSPTGWAIPRPRCSSIATP